MKEGLMLILPLKTLASFGNLIPFRTVCVAHAIAQYNGLKAALDIPAFVESLQCIEVANLVLRESVTHFMKSTAGAA